MRHIMEKFLKILRVELEDLECDIEALISDYGDRLQHHSETEHVCFENVAVLRNEEYGIRHFVRVIDSMHVADYSDLDALIAALRTRFAEEIRRAGLARASLMYADRKIEKVRRHVTECVEWMHEHRPAATAVA